MCKNDRHTAGHDRILLIHDAQEQASGSKGRKREFSGTHTPQRRKPGEFVIPKLPCRQDAQTGQTRRETRRPVTYQESRLLFKCREGRRGRSSRSSSREYWKSPPSKSRRPEGFPEAGDGSGLSDSQPPPVEEDTTGVGWDESGMDP